jgi:hypothetical protein
MKRLFFPLVLLLISLVAVGPVQSQGHLEYLGLRNQDVTSFSTYYGIRAAGTEGNGVFWNWEGMVPGTDWLLAGLEGHYVQSVYVHKSGPIGWAIGAGVQPVEGDSIFFYCSFMGQEFDACSDGITPALTWAITDLDGFPDPSICGETYAAGGGALYRREFTSPEWVPIYLTTIEGNIYTVQAHDRAPGVVLAGGGEGFAGQFFLIKSFDFGDSWENTAPPGFVLDVDFTGGQADTIFAAVGYAVQRSFDGGDSWQQVFTSQLPNGDNISEVVIAPNRQRVYIGGSSWWYEAPLFCSYDWGNTWHRVPTEMYGQIVSLQLDSAEALLFAHRTEGIFRLDPDFSHVDEMPAKVAILYQNHPNPFNPGTTIRFDLPTPAQVTLRVYDLSGRLVRALVDEIEMAAGRHEKVWDGRDETGRSPAAGVYICRLKAGEFSATRRMTLVK